MKSIKILVAASIILAFLISGCSSSPTGQPKTSEKSLTPVYTVFGEKDVSTGYAIRKVVQISIPMGLDKKAVEGNLIQAAKDMEKKYSKPDKGLAIDVYAFSKEDIELMNKGEYITIFAECTYAHNGEWQNSNVKYSSSNMKAIVKFNNENYFNKQASK